MHFCYVKIINKHLIIDTDLALAFVLEGGKWYEFIRILYGWYQNKKINYNYEIYLFTRIIK